MSTIGAETPKQTAGSHLKKLYELFMKCLSVLYGFSFVIWTSPTRKAAGKYGGLLRSDCTTFTQRQQLELKTRKGLDREDLDLGHYENKFA
ncbi:MAG: hypothetical protein WBP70_12430 [Terriglobales bacterium]